MSTTAGKLPDPLVDRREFAAYLGVSTRTLSRLRARDAIPRPVRLTRGTVRWRRSDVLAFVDGLPRR
jgi:predicted DNA-binding transcriptional regulator AlpA